MAHLSPDDRYIAVASAITVAGVAGVATDDTRKPQRFSISEPFPAAIQTVRLRSGQEEEEEEEEEEGDGGDYAASTWRGVPSLR